MNVIKTLKNGIISENPVFVQVLGMCPTLAVSTSAINGVGMGLATTAVLMGSNVAIAALKKAIPDKIRIPAFVVVIASFVTIVGLLLKAYVPVLDQSLGIYIPLIVVNCIILARAEAFASKNSVLMSAADGIGMGFGFTAALTLLGAIREVIGNGTIFGLALFPESFQPALIMILPPGGFLMLGLVLAFLNWTRLRKVKEER